LILYRANCNWVEPETKIKPNTKNLEITIWMKRLTAYVSGRVHKVGYGKKVAHLAVAFGIKGRVEYLDDGRAKIIAEGDDERLKWFEYAIDIKEHLISVSSIEKTYSPASGEFQKFVILECLEDEEDDRWLFNLELFEELRIAFEELNRVLTDINQKHREKLDGISAKPDLFQPMLKEINKK
jgi:acylphosphatase